MAILSMITEAGVDAPRAGQAKGESESESYPGIAYMVVFFAKHLGWSKDAVINTPIPELFIYYNLLAPSDGGPKFGPSDYANAEFLKKANINGPSTVKKV